MLGRKSTIGIFDCLEGQFRMLEKFPFIVGCMGNADWQVPGGEDWEGACMIKKSGNAFRIVPNKKGDERLLVNGGPFSELSTSRTTRLHLAVPRLSAHCFCRKGSQSLGRSDSKGTMDSRQWKNGNRLRSMRSLRGFGQNSGNRGRLGRMRHQAGWFGRPFWVMHLVDYLQQPEADDEEEEALTRKKSSLILIVVSSLARPVG